ncbi:MAG: hypothetical protein JRI71_09455, partial [Deltaproteobacteria bacterium]|nr:hypothetical protein [Deltaproteobacteria bacterium]
RLREAAAPAGSSKPPKKPVLFPVWNTSENILVLVDEAHRSHTTILHANLMHALPNCAKIGFTGTPIIAGRSKKKSHEIFGDYIDQYTIEQSQKDGSTVKILYEGRKAEARVEDGRTLDQFFDDMFRSRTEMEREAVRRKYGNVVNILEARDLIQAKAEDMLLHYAGNIMPNGFKAQVVAVSRRAAIRYYEAFAKAKEKLAIIIVKSMLLVGFDAPVEQVMYLDRFMHGHELLQAIYARHDIKGALINIKDELPKLDDRHRRVLSLFQERGIDDISDIDACVDELRDVRLRAEFINKFKEFTESMDIILPRPEALPYIYEMKLLGFINKAASNRYRDSQLNIAGVGTKVRQLIDEHIVAQGIDPKTQAPFLGILLEE